MVREGPPFRSECTFHPTSHPALPGRVTRQGRAPTCHRIRAGASAILGLCAPWALVVSLEDDCALLAGRTVGFVVFET